MYLSDYEAGESLGVGGAVEDSLYSCRARTLVRPISSLHLINLLSKKKFGSGCSEGVLGYILARGMDLWRRGASIR